MTWGHASSGGDSSAVQEHLLDVQHVQATSFAFSAVRRDASIVSWGHADFGGEGNCATARTINKEASFATHPLRNVANA